MGIGGLILPGHFLKITLLCKFKKFDFFKEGFSNYIKVNMGNYIVLKTRDDNVLLVLTV